VCPLLWLAATWWDFRVEQSSPAGKMRGSAWRTLLHETTISSIVPSRNLPCTDRAVTSPFRTHNRSFQLTYFLTPDAIAAEFEVPEVFMSGSDV